MTARIGRARLTGAKMDKPIAQNTCLPSSRKGLNYFPTPPWATRALCERLAARLPIVLSGLSVWEPACGAGYMARPLGEYFGKVHASDIVDHRASFSGQDLVTDFLLDWPGALPEADFIITNPPFNRAFDFIELALRRARLGVAMLVKVQFLEGITRYRELFSRRWPWLILQFAERVPMCEGRVDPDATTNQAYIWVIWLKPEFRLRLDKVGPPSFEWIAPSRKRLERPGDYPAASIDAAPDTPMIKLMEG